MISLLIQMSIFPMKLHVNPDDEYIKKNEEQMKILKTDKFNNKTILRF